MLLTSKNTESLFIRYFSNSPTYLLHLICECSPGGLGEINTKEMELLPHFWTRAPSVGGLPFGGQLGKGTGATGH